MLPSENLKSGGLKLKRWRARTNSSQSKRAVVRYRLKEEKEALARGMALVQASEEARDVTQHIAQKVQQSAHRGIVAVVTRCFEAVFDDPYEFNIDFERKRGKTEARPRFTRDGYPVDPKRGSGGGVVDIAAFALRLAALVLSKPPARRLLILDEPFKWVHSDEYRSRLRQLLVTLAAELDVQFVIITGIKELETGTIIDMGD